MELNQTLEYADSFSAFVDIVLEGRPKLSKGLKPHPRTIKLSFKGASVNLVKASHDDDHSFYRGTITAKGNEKPVSFTIKRERDVMKHVMAMLEKAAK